MEQTTQTRQDRQTDSDRRRFFPGRCSELVISSGMPIRAPRLVEFFGGLDTRYRRGAGRARMLDLVISRAPNELDCTVLLQHIAPPILAELAKTEAPRITMN